MQHISALHRSLRTRGWSFAFTQEWPLWSQKHQLSYTVPVERTAGPGSSSGLGDVALNYRYQLRADQTVALAPRVSVLFPTGNETRGLGSGDLGVQVNVPLSVSLGSSLVSHWNAGATALPRTTAYNLGASIIWLARPSFNVLVELAWTRENSGSEALILNPGIRWAHNFASGLQIVPGVAYPVGIGVSHGERGAFFYLSFEHRFRPESPAGKKLRRD